MTVVSGARKTQISVSPLTLPMSTMMAAEAPTVQRVNGRYFGVIESGRHSVNHGVEVTVGVIIISSGTD
jgi:hypothetical protein